jgi:xanthine/uracil permease
MGIFAKFAAALVAIPSAVLGGMTTFLFAAVVASGIRIISSMPFTRRNRFILTAALSVGFGATLVPDWFECVLTPNTLNYAKFPLTHQPSYVFTYSGGNNGLIGFFNAIQLVMETGFAVVAFLSLILNLVLPEEEADEELPELTADDADDAADAAEWNRLHGRPQPTDGVPPAQSEVKA